MIWLKQSNWDAKLWNLMQSRNIVNKQDVDRIKLNRTPHEQVCELLDHLAKRTDRDYEAFCECLEADDQPHVVSEILCHGAPSSRNEDVCQQLRSIYGRFEDIATGPEWASEFALDSAKFYISLHLQKGETATTSGELPLITNRTELYKSVTKFLLNKAIKRMHPQDDDSKNDDPMEEDHIEEIEADIIRPICRLSFEAYKRNEVSLSNADLEKVGVKADDVLPSGFLTKKVKVSLLDKSVKRFYFSHKTFMEYLTAKHLVQTPNDLKDWLETITDDDWNHKHYSLKEFLFDLMHGDSLLETSLVIMERFIYSHERIHNFPHSCLLLRLLRHLKEKTIILSPEMEAEFKKSCLSIINRTVTRAMFHSITITFATISHNIKPQDISMITDTEAKQFVDYLRSLDEHPHVDLIIECADKSVAFPDAMQGGLQDSFFSYAADQLISNIPLASCKEDPNDFLRIALEQGLGNDIRRMGFHGMFGEDAFESFLKAALNKPLEMLKIVICDMENAIDASCWDMLVELLSNPQLKILHIIDAFNNSIPRMQLLSQLSRLDALDELYLEIMMENTSSKEVQLYEQILKKNKMQKLKINGNEISDELRSVLQCTIPTMTALKALSFMFGRFDFWSSADDYLQLQSLSLLHLSLNSESFDNLCGIITKWTSLREIRIDGSRVEPLQTVQLRTLFTAIAKCQMLSKLEVWNLGIDDDLVDQLCEMMKSLEQLEHLNLQGNNISLEPLDLMGGTNISPTGKRKIKELAQRRKKQMVVHL
ncbi:hypothetical protein CAPTEDRAFT_210432 [Capitella teleta]|uniref:CARD domain-containing protein n=1 Tax=Capitella teleta TaxID=283909 RepID=R7TSN2_CAPTE|nr:hypothetical protein CAPTEDRAFT_210432 [Capitella teleta]|eukprot:ELT96617.1 hypothetical protein CAPTEDRAFT_210432 [Capitella teleta]